MSSLVFQTSLWSDIGYIQYNGVRLPPLINSDITFETIKDPSDRVTMLQKITLTVDFVLVPGMAGATGSIGSYPDPLNNTNTDDAFATFKNALRTSGGQLYIVDKGSGTAVIYGSATEWAASGEANRALDVKNGPTTEIVQWTPYSHNACKVTWKCVAHLRACDSEGLAATSALGIGWSTKTSIDTSGMTTRVNAGTVNAISVVGNTSFGDTDNLREVITTLFPPLDRFQRTQDYEVSEDRTTLTFSVTDEEIPSDNPYFPGLIDMDADYEIGSRLAGNSGSYGVGFGSWLCSLNFSATVAPNTTKLAAWTAFSLLLSELFKNAENASIQSSENGSEVSKPGRVIILGLRIVDSLFKRDVQINAEWALTCPLSKIFQGSGILLPFQNDYAQSVSGSAWRAYLDANGIQDARGYQNLVYDATYDSVVNPCDGTLNFIGGPAGQVYPVLPAEEEGYEDDKPDPEDSWISYENEFEIESDEGTYYGTPLGDYDAVDDGGGNQGDDRGTTREDLVNENSANAGSGGSTRITARKNHRTTYRVTMIGNALRAGYPVPAPKVLTIGGQTPTKVGRDKYVSKVVAHGTDLSGTQTPIYAGMWRQTYVLDQPPSPGVPIVTGGPESIPT